MWPVVRRADVRRCPSGCAPVLHAGTPCHVCHTAWSTRTLRVRTPATARLTPLLIGLQTLVRGYDLSTFMAQRCGVGATSCSIVDQLAGNRYAVMNLELRAPLLACSRGIRIRFDADRGAGICRRRDAVDAAPRMRRSIAIASAASAPARVSNLGGFVLEIDGREAVRQAENGWTASFLIRPGSRTSFRLLRTARRSDTDEQNQRTVASTCERVRRVPRGPRVAVGAIAVSRPPIFAVPCPPTT